MIRKILWIILLIIVSLFFYNRISIGSGDQQGEENGKNGNVKLNIPVKKFLAEPQDGAKSAYDVPIGVRIVERTPDKKWYKIRISYNFIGYFEYEGWCKVE